MQRKTLGAEKAGLALEIRQTPTSLAVFGRPDPILLFVVLGCAVTLGLVGAVSISPREGLVSFLAFSLLFSPIISVLLFNALRVRTECMLDRETGVLRIDERSYLRHVREVYDLSEVTGVRVQRLPSLPFVGGARAYGAFLDLGTADYLIVGSTDRATVDQDAWRIARFLGVPLEGSPEDEPASSTRPRDVLITGLVYFLLIALATLLLLFLLDQAPGPEPPFVGLLGAVVISQVGAMLAFAYYRARRQPQGGLPKGKP